MHFGIVMKRLLIFILGLLIGLAIPRKTTVFQTKPTAFEDAAFMGEMKIDKDGNAYMIGQSGVWMMKGKEAVRVSAEAVSPSEASPDTRSTAPPR